MGKSTITPMEARVALRMYEARDSVGQRLTTFAELAEKHGVSERTMRRHISMARCSMRPRGQHHLADLSGWIAEIHEIEAERTRFDGYALGMRMDRLLETVNRAIAEIEIGGDLRIVRHREVDQRPEGFTADLAVLLLCIFEVAGEYDLPLQQTLTELAEHWRADADE